jgi:TolA-binding protein
LGHAMPEHAREVLTALSATGLRGAEGPTETALATRGGEVGGRMMPGGGGYGGAAGGLGASGYGLPGGAPGYAAAGMPPGVSSGAMDGTKPAAGSASSTAPPATPALSLETDEAKRDVQLLAMIRQREASRSAQVAQLREHFDVAVNQPAARQPQADQQAKLPAAVPVLSEAELARQEKAIDAAYAIFQAIRKNYAETPTAEQARAEILVMVAHWRGLTQWQRSAALAARFLTDNPTDGQLPQLRLEIARDRLAYASKPLEKPMAKQAMLTEVSGRFSAARAELAKTVTEFPAEKTLQQDAQWDIANSFLTEARAIAVLSPTLARGQFIRATRELQKVADKHPTHPRIGAIPQMLWGISQELESRGYDEEAILVWNELTIHDPTNPLAQTAALKIAQTYHQKLKRPLKAAETYQELNFARGGSDQAAQDAIFRIGSELKDQKRWVEALHVLEAFVDSFPRHPQAGQALTTAGQIHQANEAWKDAIAAYRRVIAEFGEGQWVQDAKWSIAECTINLSQWSEAMAAYRDYVAAYPKDAAKVAEANRRIEVLKDLARYQGLVDEKGQRKAFDAQYQIAVIVRNQLSNPVKAIIEYRKVVTNWPESYVAAPALYEMGTAYLSLGETEKARDALRQVAEKYPTSPLASSALFMVGKSYEDEADKLASVTREKSLEQARDVAQRNAYELSQSSRARQQVLRLDRIENLKKEGKGKAAEVEEASTAANYGQFNDANVMVFAQKALQDVETLTATQLADRQDKINAALRKAVAAYTATSKIAGGNKADAALLQMATIYDQRLKDSKAAMETWLEIVRQFSGTAVAEDASWKLAQYYEREGKSSEAIDAYTVFLRNYRRSPNAGPAQFAIAENYERIGKWVAAMDSYNNYITNFPEGPLVNKAKEQINWIKTYRL